MSFRDYVAGKHEFYVLTLTEPWATLVVTGQKGWETRHWPTKYRGVLLIQAAKGFPGYARDVCYSDPFKSALLRRADLDDHERDSLFYDPVDFIATRTLGKIIGAAELTQTARTEEIHRALSAIETQHAKEEIAFGDYSAGRWAFRLEHPRRFKTPVPVRGALGIWGLQDPQAIDAVRTQLLTSGATQ